MGVKVLPYGSHHGASLRIGSNPRDSASLSDDSSWQQLHTDFQVDKELTEIEFICELRASAGEAWFDSASLRVVRVR